MTDYEPMSFDPLAAGKDEVMARAGFLRGMTIARVAEASALATGSARIATVHTKGLPGKVIEAYFSISPNTSPEPDFRAARIELKVVPLIRRGARELVVKERTSISMIDYKALIHERWESASVRKKLDAMLLVYYSTWPGADVREMRVEDVLLWRMKEEIEPTFRSDWTYVYEQVALGKAHELSERFGRVLTAATKGSGHGKTVKQPRNTIRAKPRAWALRPSYTQSVWSEQRTKGGWASLATTLHAPRIRLMEALNERFRRYVNSTLADVSKRIGVPLKEGKGAGGRLVRAVAGMAATDRIREFEETGIQVKTSRLGADLVAYEAMSFPKMVFKEFAEEVWEDSDLKRLLAGLYIVPIFGETRQTAFGDCTLGRPFLWLPTDQELESIRKEWLRFQRCIKSSERDSIPAESETEYIHIRPHGRNSSDVDTLPDGTVWPKRSFWLNKEFIGELVRRNQ